MRRLPNLSEERKTLGVIAKKERKTQGIVLKNNSVFIYIPFTFKRMKKLRKYIHKGK